MQAQDPNSLRLFGSVLQALSVLNQKMKKSKIKCCKKPDLGSAKEDLGHAESMEYILFQCNSCGKHWLNVFCVATGISGFENIDEKDANTVLNLPPGPERKAFIKEWGRAHL